MKAMQHWKLQRITAGLLVPLSYWILAFLQHCLKANYFETSAWLHEPINRFGLIAWILVVCYHTALGLQVVLEDYVSHQGKQVVAIWGVNLFFSALGLSAIVLLFQG